MHRIVMVLGFLASVATVAADSLSSALAAQARVGPDRWSRVIRIRNENPHSPYPARLHALVFEFGGILWLYTDSDGTQSFSLHRGRLEEEKADFAPLLRDIDAGFVRHEIVDAEGRRLRTANGDEVPFGCFVDCLAFHDRRAAAGRLEGPARLLTYYTEGRYGRRGHTVLVFADAGRWWVFDPNEPGRVLPLEMDGAGEARTVAREVMPSGIRHRLAKAVFTEVPALDPALPLARPPVPLVARRVGEATGNGEEARSREKGAGI